MDATRLAKQQSAPLAARRTLRDLEEEIQRSGIEVKQLQVTEVKPGLHEKAEGITIRPIYLISWLKDRVKLLGLWPVPGTDRISKKFIKLPLTRVNIPQEARARIEIISNIAEIEENAVFLSTEVTGPRLSLILAVRIIGQWFKVQRWNASWTELGISRPEVCKV